ncbi:hypothetical protein [Paenibacillus senegalimassiliensis]|uniref:hypothetical protein n=1 Tax=Paenibacillus senegalimassiliensis TaxID=1737426 RepID=UPI00073F7CDC|nr:hypothetical protein [Paenibacillus senegalimassiliensis]
MKVIKMTHKEKVDMIRNFIKPGTRCFAYNQDDIYQAASEVAGFEVKARINIRGGCVFLDSEASAEKYVDEMCAER